MEYAELIEPLESLPPEKRATVFDFVEFLATRCGSTRDKTEALCSNSDAMNNNSDPLFDKYSNVDFSGAKPVAEIPALERLQSEHSAKQPARC